MKRKKSAAALRQYERAYAKLTAQLADTGYLCKGTVVRQALTCGKPTCACRMDKKRRHGPYVYWTTKVEGRTVSRKLSAEEADIYEEWVQNRRRMQDIMRQMVALSEKVRPLLLKQRHSAR